MLRITDEAPARLRRAVAGLQALPAEVKRKLRDDTRALVVPLMRDAATRHAGGSVLRGRVAARPRLSMYRDVPGVAFGGGSSVTHDGTPGRVVARATEYGSPGTRQVRLRVHSPKGKAYTVLRHTTRMWRPEHDGGAWLTPAALEVAPRVMDEWSRMVDDAVLEAFGGGIGG